MTLDEIQRLREIVDIVRLVREGGGLFVSVGSTGWKGKCALCGDADGMHVSTRGFFHCYGCRRAGTAIDFVMARDDVGFHTACELLARWLAS